MALVIWGATVHPDKRLDPRGHQLDLSRRDPVLVWLVRAAGWRRL